ncbi:MAG: hypothetical protein RID42_15615 [Alphaproteobacteria bacterium]
MPRLSRFDENKAAVWTGWATYLVPLALAIVIGAATGQSVAYFIGMAVLSGLPVVVGVQGWIFDTVQWVERERQRRAEALRHAALLATEGAAFDRTLSEMSLAELRLLCQAFNLRQRGIARAEDAPEIAALLGRGFIYRETGYTAAGFPFYFIDDVWILIHALPGAVFAARDHAGARAGMDSANLPPIRPVAVVVPRWKRAVFFPVRLAVTIVILTVQAAGFMVFGHAVAAAYMVLVALASGILVGGAWLVARGFGWLFGGL